MHSTEKHRKLIVGNEDLFNLLQEGERIRVTIEGNSMMPLIVGGRDHIILAGASEKSLQKGRIVVARIGNGVYYLHRIERIDGERITLRGDGNPYLRETCCSSDILAEAVAIERNGKTCTPDSLLWKAAQKWWTPNPLLRRVLLAIYRRMINSA